MAKNFEEISGENHRLTDSLAELTDSKTGIKQVSMRALYAVDLSLALLCL